MKFTISLKAVFLILICLLSYATEVDSKIKIRRKHHSLLHRRHKSKLRRTKLDKEKVAKAFFAGMILGFLGRLAENKMKTLDVPGLTEAIINTCLPEMFLEFNNQINEIQIKSKGESILYQMISDQEKVDELLLICKDLEKLEETAKKNERFSIMNLVTTSLGDLFSKKEDKVKKEEEQAKEAQVVSNLTNNLKNLLEEKLFLLKDTEMIIKSTETAEKNCELEKVKSKIEKAQYSYEPKDICKCFATSEVKVPLLDVSKALFLAGQAGFNCALTKVPEKKFENLIIQILHKSLSGLINSTLEGAITMVFPPYLVYYLIKRLVSDAPLFLKITKSLFRPELDSDAMIFNSLGQIAGGQLYEFILGSSTKKKRRKLI